MHKISLQHVRVGVLVLLILTILSPVFGFAQTSGSTSAEVQQAIQQNKELKALAGEDRSIQVGRQILFDGSASTNPLDTELEYLWDFGDGSTAAGVDVTHVYTEPGRYKVTLIVRNGQAESMAEITVSAFEDLIIALSDGSLPKSEMNQYVVDASKEGVLLSVLEYASNDPVYVVEEKLSSLLQANTEEIAKADILLDLTRGSTGMNVLSKLAQSDANVNFASKSVVILQEPSSSLARIAQSTFRTLKPEYILIMDDGMLSTLWKSKESQAVLDSIQSNPSGNYRIIGSHSERSVRDFRVWNFMSALVDYMINQGVPVNTIVLILLLPVVATIFVIARQVFGIKAFGIYTPSIITLAFLAIGLGYGLLIFLVVLLSGSLVRVLFKRLRLLFLPRMAIVLTGVTLAVIALLAIAVEFDQRALVVVSIFPILVMIALVEKFVTAQIEKGFRDAARLSIETLVLSIVAYYIVSWDLVRDFILAYPEVILATIIINIILGKWTGLRIAEYYRFREIRKYLKE